MCRSLEHPVSIGMKELRAFFQRANIKLSNARLKELIQVYGHFLFSLQIAWGDLTITKCKFSSLKFYVLETVSIDRSNFHPKLISVARIKFDSVNKFCFKFVILFLLNSDCRKRGRAH